MTSRMPTPELIGEQVDGAVFGRDLFPQLAQDSTSTAADSIPQGVLVVGAQELLPTLALDLAQRLSGQKPLLHGAITIRYAIPLIQPPTQAIVPSLFAAEKGGMLVGREAWDYMQGQFQMHPRADILGLQLDGSQAQVFLRELDFGAAVRVLAYATPAATLPAAELVALVVGEGVPTPEPAPDRNDPPGLLRQFLPTLADHADHAMQKTTS